MDVSIIIVNYNTLELTNQTIESIHNKTRDISYEIILVDNNSTDGSKDFFDKDINDFKFIKNENNIGFGRANNIGIEKAKGKYIFLLNSDILLINNAVKILYDFMEENLNVGICGGNLYNENKEAIHSYGILPKFWFDIYEIYKKIYFKLLKRRLDYNYTNKPKKVGYITGADMFIRRNVLEEVGMFDPDFFMYFEESELTSRIKNAGYDVFSIPTAQIIHLEGKSFKFKEVKFRMMVESKYKYFRKVYTEKEAFYTYIFSQIKYLLYFNGENRIKFRINREEYTKSIN